MKKSILFLSAACCLALPAASWADDYNTHSAKTTKATAKAGMAAAVASNHPKMICYITDRPRTGSNIPMVYRQYNGRIDSASNAAVYGQESLRFTGSEDTATALYKLDPSITLSAQRR